MTKNFVYNAETFNICVNGKNYEVNTSKLILIQKMQTLCEKAAGADKREIIDFIDALYDCLNKILGKSVFDEIFNDKLYDLIFLTDFCVYLAQEAAPHFSAINKRFADISAKYSKDNLNESVNSPIADKG